MDAQRREFERIQREMALVSLVLGREVRQERVFIELVDDIDLEALQHSKGRVYAVALAFNKKSELFWRELFDDLEHARPPVLGITLPVGNDSPEEAAFDSETPLYLPLGGVAFADVAEIKNELFSRIMSGRR